MDKLDKLLALWLGEQAFFFHDTHGIPRELFLDWCERNSKAVKYNFLLSLNN